MTAMNTPLTTTASSEDRLLAVRNLRVDFTTYGGTVRAVRDISFHLNRGECMAIVGESGCGKSVTALSILKLIPMPPGKMSGSILFKGTDLVSLSEREMNRIRGREIGMVFQDPMTSLNPTMPIGQQVEEILAQHTPLSGKERRRQALDILRLVDIPEAERRYGQYPHAFSGGMRQRVLIAMAIACRPSLLIADEPTTALDVTIQAQILELVVSLRKSLGTTVLLITHDLGVVAKMADRIAVFYAGQIVETGECRDIFRNPAHPYTQALLASIPRIDATRATKLASIAGTPPDLFSPPQGCAFFARCTKAMRVCATLPPPPLQKANGQVASCWLHHSLAESRQKTVPEGAERQ